MAESDEEMGNWNPNKINTDTNSSPYTRADSASNELNVSMETIKSCKVKYIATHTQVGGEKNRWKEIRFYIILLESMTSPQPEVQSTLFRCSTMWYSFPHKMTIRKKRLLECTQRRLINFCMRLSASRLSARLVLASISFQIPILECFAANLN